MTDPPDRPDDAVDRMDKAEAALKLGDVRAALPLLWDEIEDASRRGDPEQLEAIAALATKMEQASTAEYMRKAAATLAEAAEVAAANAWAHQDELTGASASEAASEPVAARAAAYAPPPQSPAADAESTPPPYWPPPSGRAADSGTPPKSGWPLSTGWSIVLGVLTGGLGLLVPLAIYFWRRGQRTGAYITAGAFGLLVLIIFISSATSSSAKKQAGSSPTTPVQTTAGTTQTTTATTTQTKTTRTASSCLHVSKATVQAIANGLDTRYGRLAIRDDVVAVKWRKQPLWHYLVTGRILGPGMSVGGPTIATWATDNITSPTIIWSAEAFAAKFTQWPEPREGLIPLSEVSRSQTCFPAGG